MPKYNKFSERYEPDRDTCTEASEFNVARFRQAQLKVDRISNGNEEELAFKIVAIATRYNKTGERIPFDLDYADSMSVLEEVYNDVDAEMMIMALETLASDYGYLPEMDNESVELEQEMFWFTKESFSGLIGRIQAEYAGMDKKYKNEFKNRIAGGMRLYEINKNNTRPDVKRGEVWKVEVPIGVGRETTGFRWVVVISNEAHADHSDVVNVVYLDGEKPKNRKSHMGIKNTDLSDGKLEKEGRVNITDINTLDKKRFTDYKGKVSDEFLKKLMGRISLQLGISKEPEYIEVNFDEE